MSFLTLCAMNNNRFDIYGPNGGYAMIIKLK